MSVKVRAYLWAAWHASMAVAIVCVLGAMLFIYNVKNDPCTYYRIEHRKLGIVFMKNPELACLPKIEYEFELGQPVEKFTGDYSWKGVVVSRFATTSGAERYVVEHKADTGGVLHIYGPKNLRVQTPVTEG